MEKECHVQWIAMLSQNVIISSATLSTPYLFF